MQGPCTFIEFATCSGVVDTAGADVGFRLASLPSSLDSCCLSRSIGHVRCSSFVLAALVGMERDLVMDALALILPIWRPASSAKALVDDISLLSPSISRYCYLWFGQPQLLSNATSGYGFHATASRLSQLVPSRSLSSDAHSRTSCGTKKCLSIFFFFFFNALRRHALRRHAFRRRSPCVSQSRPPGLARVWLMDISILFPTNF